ncbi:MAG TPA: DUF456 domain-containing protein [Actinomycetota bacterium]|nr:DUF456 domain-containing protein [Actinomycetota bacterium]
MSAIGVFLVALTMLVGLLGVVLPFFPGLPIVWGAALVYGLFAGFSGVGWVAFAVITALMVAGMTLGLVLPHRRAASAGAPRTSVIAGLVLGVIGFFVVPIVGLPLGAILGVLLAEKARTGDWATAWTATKAMVVGFGLGVLVQLAAGLGMVGCWALWVLAD